MSALVTNQIKIQNCIVQIMKTNFTKIALLYHKLFILVNFKVIKLLINTIFFFV